MNPEQNRRQCVVCGEVEPSFIHSVIKSGVFRRLCTDCLLKEHRDIFCPVCFEVFVEAPPQHACIVCLNCPSSTHLPCSLPPSFSSSAAASSFTCPPCSDPNFSFFPKSRDQTGENDEDGWGNIESAKALVAAAKIAVISMKKAAAQLKEKAVKKILEAKNAKMRAKEALGILQDLVIRQKATENSNPNKRKNNDG